MIKKLYYNLSFFKNGDIFIKLQKICIYNIREKF